MSWDEVKPVLTGVVSVRLKELRKLDVIPEGGPRAASYRSLNVFTRWTTRRSAVESSRRFVRASQVAGGSEVAMAELEESIHVPVTLQREKPHPGNLLRCDVVVRDAAVSDSPERIVSSLTFHLYDLVGECPVSGAFDMYRSNVEYAGELRASFQFHYGLFGYGYSAQLPSSTRTVEEQVRTSLFPRVSPPPEREDELSATMIPRAVGHPDFIPFDTKVLLGLEVAPEPRPGSSVARVQARMDRVQSLKAAMDAAGAAGGRVQKLQFLWRQVSGRAQNEDEERVRLAVPRESQVEGIRWQEEGIPRSHAAAGRPSSPRGAGAGAAPLMQPAGTVSALFGGPRSPVFTASNGTHSAGLTGVRRGHVLVRGAVGALLMGVKKAATTARGSSVSSSSPPEGGGSGPGLMAAGAANKSTQKLTAVRIDPPTADVVPSTSAGQFAAASPEPLRLPGSVSTEDDEDAALSGVEMAHLEAGQRAPSRPTAERDGARQAVPRASRWRQLTAMTSNRADDAPSSRLLSQVAARPSSEAGSSASRPCSPDERGSRVLSEGPSSPVDHH